MATSWQEILDLGQRAPAPASAEAASETERRGVLRRLRESLSKSRQALTEEISASFFDRIDDETWERLEEALILADAGAPTTAKVVERLEGGGLSLEESIAAFEDGIKLARAGAAKLEEAERKVEVLLEGDRTAPFSGQDK